MDSEPNKQDQPSNGPATATLEPPKTTTPNDDETPVVTAPTTDDSVTPPVTPAVTTTEKPKRNKSKLIIIVAVVLLFLGGSALAFFTIYIPYAENQIFENTLANTFNATSVKADAVITLDQAPEGVGDLKLKAAVTQTGDAEFSASIDILGGPITADLKYIDDVAYIRVGGISDLLSFAGLFTDLSSIDAYQPYISSIDNQWISIDKSFLKTFGIDVDSLTATTASGQGTDPAVIKLFQENPFIKLDERLDDVNIGDTSNYHYTLKIDTTVMASFLDALVQSGYSDVTTADATKVKTTLDASTVEALNLELWVDQNQEVLSRVMANSSTLGSGFTATIDLTDYNGDFTLDPPVDAVSILNLITQLTQSGVNLSPFLGGGLN